MSYLLPHLHSGWAVDQAILAEEERLVIIRFGHDWDETCMQVNFLCYFCSFLSINDLFKIYVIALLSVNDIMNWFLLDTWLWICFFGGF